MLINEAAGIVNLIMNHQIEILLRRMRRDIRIGEFLRHADCVEVYLMYFLNLSSSLDRASEIGKWRNDENTLNGMRRKKENAEKITM